MDEPRDRYGHQSKQEPDAPPEDMRDTYGNAGPPIGDAVAAGEIDVALPEGGPYPMPSEVERPHASREQGAFPGEPNRDPSLSRAVDRETVGLAPEQAGYDRSMEGPPPGPLDPDAESESPDNPTEPGGAWGSSG